MRDDSPLEPPEAGLRELRRVARGPVVVFTFELAALPAWQREHLAEALAIEEPRFPSIAAVREALGGRTRVERIPTPGDCMDGFFEAFWRRPEALLDPLVRASQSLWTLVGRGVEERIVDRLRAALQSGEWDREHGHLRTEEGFDGSLRLVISEPARSERLQGTSSSLPVLRRASSSSWARRASSSGWRPPIRTDSDPAAISPNSFSARAASSSCVRA